MSKDNQKGFGLLEVIVAVLIVAVGLVGILTLANMSLKGASTSKMRLIASGLAQEGIEVVRDIRRSEMEWDNWYASISNDDYQVQYNTTNLTMPDSGAYLRMNANGLYQYDSGPATLFKRKVTLTKNSADEVKVVVEIEWSDHTLAAEDRLWNWK